MEATPDKVLYTDGHDVTVTDSTLQVNKHEYHLDGVTKCALMVLRPNRAPGIILLILGMGLIVVGVLQLIAPGTVPASQIADESFDANAIAIAAGAALALIGILILGLLRERYSVRIATAEGEKDAVVSKKREYIGQIVDAINQSISFVRTKGASQYFSMRSAEDKLGNAI